jgi:hypothetical protein
MILGTGWHEVRGICKDDVLINGRELLGSLEITALAQRLAPAGAAGEAENVRNHAKECLI